MRQKANIILACNRAKGIEILLEQVKSTGGRQSMGRIGVRPSNQYFKRSMGALPQSNLRASSSMVGIASAFSLEPTPIIERIQSLSLRIR